MINITKIIKFKSIGKTQRGSTPVQVLFPGDSLPFEGTIDEVVIYKEVLSAEEILNHYIVGL